MWKLARRIFTVLSLLLLIGAVGMWIRGQWAWHVLRYERVMVRDDQWRLRGIYIHVYRSSLDLIEVDGRVEITDEATRESLRRELQAPTRAVHEQGAPSSLLPVQAAQGPDLTYIGGGGFAWETWGSSANVDVTMSVTLGNFTYSVNGFRSRSLAVPWWFLTLLFSALPLHALWRWRKSRRVKPGCCRHCGYDLRSTADGSGPLVATCPECGRSSEQAAINAVP